VARLAEIYALVKKYRIKVPPSYQAMIRGTIEAASSDSEVWHKTKNEKNNIFYSVDGIGGGVWGLRSMQRETPLAIDITDPNLNGGTVAPGKALVQTYRVIRDTKLCRDIKKMYNYECQICGTTIKLPSEGRYAEAHHIIPLGSPHYGSDKADNIIVVCPNHHAMLDYGVIKLDPSSLSTQGKHRISDASIDYHNLNIHGKLKKSQTLLQTY